MKNTWQDGFRRYGTLQFREQLLITLVGIVLVLALNDQLFFSPSAGKTAQLNANNEGQAQLLSALEGEHLALAARLAEDPDRAARTQLEAAKQRLASQNGRLKALTVDLIPPAQMAGVLREVLAQRPGLHLLSLENLPAEPAFPIKTDAKATVSGEIPASPAPAIYRHGLRMTVSGDYFTVLEYLKALEQLPWHFYFEGLDYQVQTHPQAEVTLTLYTLSDREAWIGT